MVALKLQKRLSASVLKCCKVWLDPNEVNESSMANSRKEKKQKSKKQIVTRDMASLTAFQPTADIQPADDILKQFNSNQQSLAKCDDKAIADMVILTKYLDIAGVNDKRYWQYRKEFCQQKKILGKKFIMDVTELLRICWFEVRGKISLDKFAFGTEYCISFVIMRTPEAQNLFNIKLALEFDHGRPSEERVVEDLNKILPANKWVTLKVADFKKFVGGPDTEMTISLTNYDGAWKRGLKIAGILIHPKPPA